MPKHIFNATITPLIPRDMVKSTSGQALIRLRTIPETSVKTLNPFRVPQLP